jgi:hypothetical protein
VSSPGTKHDAASSRARLVPLILSLTVLGVSGCGATSDPNFDSASLFRGSVKTDSGETLVAFCDRLSTSPADVVKFRAPPGTKVFDEVMREARSYQWYGGDTGDPPLGFWCNGGGEASSGAPGTFPRCLRVADADPPASLDKSEDRGSPTGREYPGYALSLTVLHPGVLHLTLDAQCVRDVYGETQAVSGVQVAELTILPN